MGIEADSQFSDFESSCPATLCVELVMLASTSDDRGITAQLATALANLKVRVEAKRFQAKQV